MLKRKFAIMQKLVGRVGEREGEGEGGGEGEGVGGKGRLGGGGEGCGVGEVRGVGGGGKGRSGVWGSSQSGVVGCMYHMNMPRVVQSFSVWFRTARARVKGLSS